MGNSDQKILNYPKLAPLLSTEREPQWNILRILRNVSNRKCQGNCSCSKCENTKYRICSKCENENIEFVVKIQKFVKNVEKGNTDFFDTKKGEWHNVS